MTVFSCLSLLSNYCTVFLWVKMECSDHWKGRVSSWLFPGCGNSLILHQNLANRIAKRKDCLWCGIWVCRVPLFFVTLKSFGLSHVQMNLLFIFLFTLICLLELSVHLAVLIFQIDTLHHRSPRWHSLSLPIASLESVWGWTLQDNNSRCGFCKIPVSAWKLNFTFGNTTIGVSLCLEVAGPLMQCQENRWQVLQWV